MSSRRIRSPSSTGTSLVRDCPSSCQAPAPENLREVSTDGHVPASAATGSGRGVRSSQMPPSAVAATRCRSSSVPASPSHDWADTCTASPERDRARSYQPGDRQPPRHRRELIHAQQDLPLPAEREAGEQVCQRPGLRLRHGALGRAFEHAVPGVAVGERPAPVESGAEPAPQRPEPQFHVFDGPRAGPDGSDRVPVAAGRVGCGQPARLSSRARKSAELAGGPQGAPTARATMASMMSV